MKEQIKEHWKLIIFLFIVTFFILQLFVVSPCLAIGESMYPTLANGDIQLIIHNNKNIERYDIIGVYIDKKLCVKRVIGLPGETIQYKNNKLYIDEKEIEDKYFNDMNDYGMLSEPVTLKNDEYIVLGDNRNNSKDCRIWGPIKKENIKGKLLLSE